MISMELASPLKNYNTSSKILKLKLKMTDISSKCTVVGLIISELALKFQSQLLKMSQLHDTGVELTYNVRIYSLNSGFGSIISTLGQLQNIRANSLNSGVGPIISELAQKLSEISQQTSVIMELAPRYRSQLKILESEV